ncbi:Uncharacterised protein [Streptococcus pyogenes]|nr:Uncharacterised protein [Streptococcus pyogenes]VGR06996.1 Uncharacterised protein [Streptococcus pyogenes]VHA79376.1 Uncharacterised protein [Streptococcus pyogenes]
MKRENKGKTYSPNGLGKPLFRMFSFYDSNLKVFLNDCLECLYF